MTYFDTATDFDTDNELMTCDRRRSVRTAPVIDGTGLWIEEDRRIQVEVVDESPNGIGVVIPADVSFEFGPKIFIDYDLERRSASIAHLTQLEDGSYRLGLTWNS